MKHSVASTFTRGGDIWRHELNLLLSNSGAVAAPALAAGAVTYAATAYLCAQSAWPLYWTYGVARVADTLGLGRFPLFSVKGYVPSDFLTTFTGVYDKTFLLTTPVATVAAAATAFAVGRAIWKRFMTRAANLKDEHLRGAQLQTQEQLIELVEQDWVVAKAKADAGGYPLPHRYSIVGVPIPAGMVQRNILCTGGMGSGKSVAIYDLADQAAAAGRTMIIYDKVTEFADCYFREGVDVIFNPFDSRFPGWSPFNEITQIYEFDQIAEYLIPKGTDGNETSDYFKSAARTIFACVMQRLREEGRATNEALSAAIFETGQEALYEWLKGTAAESLLNPDSKGTGGGGVLSTLTEAVKVLRYVKTGPFSLKQFIRDGGDRRLFITSKEEVHPIVGSLTSMALGILYTSVMSGKQVRVDKYWFFLDEFRSLGKLSVFNTAVTEGRRYGAVNVVGVQNVAQLVVMFGKEDAKTVLSNLQNQLILRVTDDETQESYSKMIGAGEYAEQSEGVSWGAASSKDGASINTARKERRAVLASEIKLLADCTGYLQLAGNFNIAEVSYVHRSRAVIAGGWSPRSDLDLPAYVPAADASAEAPVAIAASRFIDPTEPVDAAAPPTRAKRKLV